MLSFLVITLLLGIWRNELVDSAPAAKNAIVPPEPEYVNLYKNRVVEKYDERLLATEKCEKTPLEWPEIRVREHLFTGEKGRIEVVARSWLRLKLSWQKMEEDVWYGKQLYSYGVPLAESSIHHQIKNYFAGNEYQTELVIHKTAREDLQPRRFSLVVYILHPCHQVVLTLRNLEKLNGVKRALRLRFPELAHLPRNVYDLSPGADLNLEILMKDENPANPKVVPWMKLYERRGDRVDLTSLKRRQSFTTFDRSDWEGDVFVVSTAMHLNQIGYREAGLYGLIYTPDLEDPLYDLFVYSEIRLAEAFPALNIYSCSSVHNTQELRLAKTIGFPGNRPNCFYCVAFSSEKPTALRLTIGKGVERELQPSSYVTLGESYYLAQFPIDDLAGEDQQEVTCSLRSPETEMKLSKRVVLYEDVTVEEFKLVESKRGGDTKFRCLAEGKPKPDIEFYTTFTQNLENLVNTNDVIDTMKADWTRLRASRYVTIHFERLSALDRQSSAMTLTISKNDARRHGIGRHKLAYICLAKNDFNQSYLILRDPR